jgi:hypothetical protein
MKKIVYHGELFQDLATIFRCIKTKIFTNIMSLRSFEIQPKAMVIQLHWHDTLGSSINHSHRSLDFFIEENWN